MSRLPLAAASFCLAAAVAADAGELRRSAEPVAGSYIVVLDETALQRPDGARLAVADVAAELAWSYGAETTFVYQHALQGFAARMGAESAAAMAQDERVRWVEEDGVARAVGSQTPATWGLDRVDQRALPLNNTYNYNQSGSGVHAYIVDTGVNGTHVEFSGRFSSQGYDAIGGGTNDCNGHGTHVAGTVGGTTYGLAKSVIIHAVRVLNCQGSGSWSQVISGVDWVTGNHVKPAVANMSLGGSANSSLDAAVSNSIAAGVSYAIAAGNSNADACGYSPARVANAVTVGSTTNTDARSSFSNWGTCLDIFAPGSSITSAWIGSNTATNTISGTSMASPHVAGAIALYLQTNPTASPATVAAALRNIATANVVGSPGTGSPNYLLYSLFTGGGGGDTTPPTTAITSPTGGTVSGTITISATASDNVGVTNVEFYRGSVLIGADNSAPYSVSWNTAGVANGNHVLQTKAYDAAGNVGTSSPVTVNVQNAAPAELIRNGGFEGSAANWTLFGDAYWSNGSYPHGGSGYTVLGYYDNANGYEYQVVSIPATAPAQLTFWLNISTWEFPFFAYDYFYVEVYNTQRVLLARLATFSNLNSGSAGAYTMKTYSLAPWRGQTVAIVFRATTDYSLPTTFRVDDVSLK